MNRHFASFLCAISLVAVACEKKEAPAAEASTAAAAPVPPTPSAAPAVELSDADLAVSEDFEDDADKEISESNYKAELSALEKEIDAPE